MSSTVDNITLTLLSLKKYIYDYLNDNKWRNKFSIFLAGDKNLINKTIVIYKTDMSNEISLPIITIDTGSIRSEPFELGADSHEYVTVAIGVMAKDDNELRTLSNFIRRKLDNLIFTIYDHTESHKPAVDTGLVEDPVLIDTSDLEAVNAVNRYSALISATIELNMSEFI
jgi:hypothetical protein